MVPRDASLSDSCYTSDCLSIQADPPLEQFKQKSFEACLRKNWATNRPMGACPATLCSKHFILNNWLCHHFNNLHYSKRQVMHINSIKHLNSLTSKRLYLHKPNLKLYNKVIIQQTFNSVLIIFTHSFFHQTQISKSSYLQFVSESFSKI